MRIQNLIVAALLFAAPPFAPAAFAHDGVHIDKAYARVNGGIGATGAVFFEVQNHADVSELLIGVASDIAEKVELHTHMETADGVMQMNAVPEGFPIDALMSRSLKRGSDHIMLMGLRKALKDGDMIHLTLTFEHAGVVELDAVVDNQRKAEAPAMDMSGMDMSKMDMTTPTAPSN